MTTHSTAFPPRITLHNVTKTDGIKVSLLVDVTETFGHALARAGVKDSEVSSVEVVGAPIWYEPEYAIATR